MVFDLWVTDLDPSIAARLRPSNGAVTTDEEVESIGAISEQRPEIVAALVALQRRNDPSGFGG